MFFDGAKPRDLRFLLVLAQTPKLVASQRTAVQQSSLNLLGPERSSKQSTRYIVKKSIIPVIRTLLKFCRPFGTEFGNGVLTHALEAGDISIREGFTLNT